MKKTLTALALTALLFSGNVMAQDADTTVPGHPRVNEVDQRLNNQDQRIDKGAQDGQINAKQEMRDDKLDNKVSSQMSADEAKHNGHITKAEQRHMNKELNKNSKRIHRQRHAVKPAAATPAQ